MIFVDNAPTFSNLPDTITVSNSVTTGTSLYTVNTDDVDTYDVSSLSVSMTTVNSDYSFDTGTCKLL